MAESGFDLSGVEEEGHPVTTTTIVDVHGDEVGQDGPSPGDPNVAGPSNVIVDDSPLQHQMERNKECKIIYESIS